MHLWVIWDGPTQSENFQPVSATRYARLLDGAYAALKAREQAQPRRRRQLLHRRQGHAAALDPLAQARQRQAPADGLLRPRRVLHAPPGPRRVTLGKGTADLSDIDTLHEWVDDAFGTKRLFITNFTLPTNDNWRYDFKVSASTQASWLTAALRIAKREKYIYSLAYNGLYDEESRGDDKQVESGLIELDGTKRSAFNAFKRG